MHDLLWPMSIWAAPAFCSSRQAACPEGSHGMRRGAQTLLSAHVISRADSLHMGRRHVMRGGPDAVTEQSRCVLQVATDTRLWLYGALQDTTGLPGGPDQEQPSAGQSRMWMSSCPASPTCRCVPIWIASSQKSQSYLQHNLEASRGIFQNIVAAVPSGCVCNTEAINNLNSSVAVDSSLQAVSVNTMQSTQAPQLRH